MRSDERTTGDQEGAARPPAADANGHTPVWDSAFDAPILAGNVAHELTNALFALHLHLDPVRGNGHVRSRTRRKGAVRNGEAGASIEASRKVVSAILGRLDELSRGLRMVARAPKAPRADSGPPRTSLEEWWSTARVVLHVSVPKGVDLQADWPSGLPELEAEPAELTACTVAIVRHVIGRDRVAPPCTLRLLVLPEGRWVRLLAIAHPLSEEFSAAESGEDGRFRIDATEPSAASVLIARAEHGQRRATRGGTGRFP